jgi:hypothetical protein
MESTRENILNTLTLWLEKLLYPVPVKRNEALPMKVPPIGMVIVRDGQIGEPDIILSPTRYIYRHRAEVEVFMQKADQPERDMQFDGLLVQLGAALELDPTLFGLVDYMSIGTPELMEEHIEGAPTLKAAVVPVILEYSTLNPLT